MKCDAQRVRDRCVMYRQAKSKIFPYELYNYLLVPKNIGLVFLCIVLGLSRSKKVGVLFFFCFDRFFKMLNFLATFKKF
jgi:hypothetical protein